jgi:hypothetical protein
MKRVSLKTALKFIQNSKGQIFSIMFEKRSDGTMRTMRCRTGVKKFLAENPSKPGVDFESNYSLCVCDMDLIDTKHPYRTIPVEGIRNILMNGEWRFVVQTVSRVDLSYFLKDRVTA